MMDEEQTVDGNGEEADAGETAAEPEAEGEAEEAAEQDYNSRANVKKFWIGCGSISPLFLNRRLNFGGLQFFKYICYNNNTYEQS